VRTAAAEFEERSGKALTEVPICLQTAVKRSQW